MKNLILAASTVLSMSASVVPASAVTTIAGDAQATRIRQTGADSQ